METITNIINPSIIVLPGKNGKVSAASQRMSEALSLSSKAVCLGAALAGNKVAKDSLKAQAVTLDDFLMARRPLDGGSYPAFLALMVTACGGQIPTVSKGEYRSAVDIYIRAGLMKLEAAVLEQGNIITKSQSARMGLLQSCKFVADKATAEREAALAARAMAEAGLTEAPAEVITA